MATGLPLTTAQVPAQFHKAALLLGQIPLRALASDPRVSYTLYVPPKHYNSHISKTTRDGESVDDKLPLLVYIHGTGRNISAMYSDFVAFADSTPCAVAAPVFPAGLDGPHDIDSYKLLRSSTLRSDLALLSMLEEIACRWPGIDANKVFLFGWSGGAQFAHRFLYLYPGRLAAVSVGAPGLVTLLDDQRKWPAGIADVETLFGRTVRKDLIGLVPIQLLVGGADSKIHGGKEFWDWLQSVRGGLNGEAGADNADALSSTQIMRQGRLDTLNQLQTLWKQDRINARLDTVEGVAHEANKMREHALRFLRPLLQSHHG